MPQDRVPIDRPIQNEDEYDLALQELYFYFEKEPEIGTPEAGRFATLCDLVEEYEARVWPFSHQIPNER